jgi:uncharacterized protein
MALPQRLVDMVRCPKCDGKLELRDEGFACGACKLLYRVEDDLPNFILEDARPLER